MLGDTLYVSTPYNRVVALDANVGRELWSFDPDATRWGTLGDERAGYVHRGVAVWSGGGARRVFLNSRWRLIALDSRTGKPIPSFGTNGEIDLTHDLSWPVNRNHYGNTSPPVVWRDLVIVGSAVADPLVHDRDPPGDVQAFDVHTGTRVWRWKPIPGKGEPGSETWKDGANERTGHGNVWAPFTMDTARGLVYLPVSTPSNDWYGGRRKGAGLFGESLVCLDARTGRRVWHYQLVHHGLWDYDPPAPPVLVSIVVDGRPIDAVALPGKTGFVYVFERATGKPVWPIEERPVPASDVPGEEASVTQPFPTRPPPFARQGVADSDLVNFTPELLTRGRAMLRSYRVGPLFTPPSLQGTVVLPGWQGGSGWGGAAFDPASGTLYVKASNRAVLARLVPPAAGGPDSNAKFILDHSQLPTRPLNILFETRTGLLRRFSKTVPIPLIRPPYGTLTAIDLNRGVLRWQMAIGDTPKVRFHPRLRALKLPPLGVEGSPGPLVTAGGLLFLTGGGSVLFALDAASGAVRWSWDLGRTGYSNPMTYRTGSGRQFVVLATGVGAGSRLRAFSLPLKPE
jgi:quinoprotein glucose dehydrogenase